MRIRRADTVKAALENLIVSGQLCNGERLNEAALAERFSVSRTPLREAIQALAVTGLVELKPRRGAFVRHPDFGSLVEMFEVMAELEALCAKHAARRITESGLEKLIAANTACDQAFQAGNAEDYCHENENFHHILYLASGNRFLAGEAEKLQRRLQTYRRMQLTSRSRMRHSVNEHRKIVAAITQGDAELAAETLREHISIQGEKFTDLIASYQTQLVQKKHGFTSNTTY